MKAPDKIYLHGYDFDKEPCVKWHEKPMEKGMRGYHVVNVEYISKDLLLAWAKQKQYESTTIVADNFWQEVIDKINEI